MKIEDRLHPLGGATLRANPDLRFVPAKAMRSLGWREDGVVQTTPVFTGALRPRRQRWIGVRAVDSTAAALFDALRRPRRIPPKFARLFGEQVDREIASLVLDGVLEIEHGGGFVSGATAYDAVFRVPRRPSRAGGLTGTLSTDAVRYAASLPLNDVQRLAMRMYCFNRAPATPSWRRRLPTIQAVDSFLDVAPGCIGRSRMDLGWRHAGRPVNNNDWSFWQSRSGNADSTGPLYKIFVSPTLEAAPEALRVTVGVMLDHGAPPFKFGGGLYALLRPDKIVIYFNTKAEMRACGAALCRALAGIPVHGVPFSAGLGADGLVSWGMDPLKEKLALANRGSESWRIWVTSRLARALLVARHATSVSQDDVVSFALDRLALHGVDPRTWAPGTD